MRIKGDGETSRKNTVFFVIFGVVCFLMASSVLPFFTVFGTLPCPDLLLCFCCILPKFCDVKRCCIYALSLGFLSDLFINTPHHLSPLLYLAAVVFIPYFYGYFKRLGTVTAAVCSVPVLALKGVIGTVIVLSVRKGAGLWSVIYNVTLPEMIINFAFILILGFILRLLTRFFGIQKENAPL